MQTTAADREDLGRLADDGCPHPPADDTATHDLAELWQDIGGSD
jgi:hypothetical protein